MTPDEKECRRWLGALSDYVDGELARDLCAEIERHLEQCPDCRVVVDTLRKTIYLFRVNAEEPQVPAEVRQRLYAALELEELLSGKDEDGDAAAS